MTDPVTIPRWPKGPFPERYRFAAVEARLEHAWDEPDRKAFFARLEAKGFELLEPRDPWVRVVRSPDLTTFASLRDEAQAARCTAFLWVLPGRTRAASHRLHDEVGRLLGVVPTEDLVDAVSAVGVAGPSHGIGLSTVVRFLVTLRSFARFGVDAMGEDRLDLDIAAKNELAAERIAERVLRICPPLARQASRQDVVEMIRRGRLSMDWA